MPRKAKPRKPKKSRRDPLSGDPTDILREQREAFRKKFGRDPGPNDPIFFDPDADEPRAMGDITDEVVKGMRETGLPAQFIYAYKKTGLLLMEGMLDHYPPDAVEEWERAIDEYFKLEEEAGGETRPDPRRYKTKIPELLARPLTREEHEDVRRCLAAVDEVLSKPQSVMMRVELAAALLAHACAQGYAGAKATGYEGDPQDIYDTFERIAVLRSRELYSQDRA